jgi:D-xylose 1-dehydrogenase (NADP+, D-xylono-1,5-lactone-forming)
VIRVGLLSTAKINGAILGGADGSERLAVTAVASRDLGRAEAYAREHGLERAHGSYEPLLDDPDVDAVYISLPNGLHHEWTLRSLEAGKHVLCEKPYSRRPVEVEEAFDLAAGRGLVLMEAFMYRHHPQTSRVRELVAEGAIGRLRSIAATFTFALTDQGNIRMLPELDGGALMDVGCYCVSGARLLAGEPVRAFGEAVTAPSGVDVALHGTLRFPDGVVAQLEASFVLPRRQRLVVAGEAGELVVEAPWRVDWGGQVRLHRDGAVETLDVPGADSYRLQLENLADAIEGRAPALLGADDAIGQARAIDALYRSAAEGRAVEL